MADMRPLPPALPTPALLSSFHDCPPDSKRLILLDYDGTLAPHVSDPAAAVPTPFLLRVLATLAADERNALWVISGRDGDFLEKHLGAIRDIGMSCEHGGFMREPGGTEWVGRGMYETPQRETWERVRHVLKKHVKRLEGAFIEYKKSSFTFAYRNAPSDLATTVLGEMQLDLESVLATEPGIVVKQGVFVIEVRPVGIDKGEISRGLIRRYPSVGFALAAGDEGTDEDMFAALHAGVAEGAVRSEDAWSVFVDGAYGLRSCARYMVPGIPDIIGVLAELAGIEK